MRYHTLLLTILIFGGYSLQGQLQFDNYKFLTEADGLPSRYATDISEDKYGFIWIATAGGLVRYDGSMVSVLEQRSEDATFLQSDYVNAVLAVGDSIWIGTMKGLSIFDINTGLLSNHSLMSNHFPRVVNAGDKDYETAVRSIFEDREGNIWLTPGFGGFVKWEKATGKFIEFPLYPDDELPKTYTHGAQTSLVDLIQDVKQDSILWGVCLAGLVKLNQVTGNISKIYYEEGDEKANFQVNRKICVYQDDKSGILYTGSWGGGLSTYAPIAQEYKWLKKDLKIKRNEKNDFDLGHLYNIIPGEDGKLYLTFEMGLYLFDPITQELISIKRNVFKGQQKIFGLDYFDSEGRGWDVNNHGVSVVDPIEHQFRKYSLSDLNKAPIELIPRAIVEDFYEGYLTLAAQYSDGLYHINLQSGASFKTPIPKFYQSSDMVSMWGATKLDDSRLLVSGADLLILDKDKGEFFQFGIELPAQYSNYRSSILSSDGEIWMGTKGDGLITVDLDRKTAKSHYSQLPYPSTRNPFQDEMNNIWLLTNYGHVVYDRNSFSYHVFDYNQDSSKTFLAARNFCQCPNGEVWLAGETEGIGLVSKRNPEAGILNKIILTDHDGVTVSASRIACDENNQLWSINRNNLYQINRSDWTVETFDINAYGARNWHGMFQFLKNGKLFLSSRDGFYTVDPRLLKKNEKLPIPYVSKVTSNLGVRNGLEQGARNASISLEANENIITIEFSAINHSISERTKYLYKLEGLDKDWIDPKDKRTLTYSYVPGGEYTFKLKAGNNEGVWNDKIYTLPIFVGTPWYKTVWFAVLTLLFLLSLTYIFYRYRVRHIRNESQLKAKFEKQKADLEMSALKAQMNPHFIFNCLNSIEAYIIRNDSAKAATYLNNFGRLVRLILQNSRSSYVNLQDELEALELYMKLEQMRLRNSFDYQIHLTDHLNPENFEIPPMLIQPFVENAIWHGLQHSNVQGKVTITIGRRGEFLQIVVIDNGIGREASKKINSSKKIRRKSMGMNITSERIHIINKVYETQNELKIEDLYKDNQHAAGTKVTITIPL